MAEAFNLPFTEAIEYFLGKVPLSDGQVRQLTSEARDRAFWVSKVSHEGLLETFYGQTLRALEQGTTFNDFKKVVGAEADKLGVGPRNPFRLATIFETNLASAYSAGHYRQLTDKDVLAKRPFWRWVAVMDSQTRPSHAALHGRVWQAGDKWWDKGFPPLGFRCRCTVQSLSPQEARARGIEVEESADGEVMVLGRPMIIDEGFDHNPGLVAWGRPPAQRAIKARQGTEWESLAKSGWREAGRPERLPARPLPAALTRQMESEAELKQALTKVLGAETRLLEDPLGQPILASVDMAEHLAGKGRGPYLPLLPHVIQDPAEIWLQPVRSARTGRVAMRRIYVQNYERKTGRGVAVVAEYQKGCWTGYTTYPEGSAERLNRFRQGWLEWREGQG